MLRPGPGSTIAALSASLTLLLGALSHAGCSSFGDEPDEQQQADSGGGSAVEGGREVGTTDGPISSEDAGADAQSDAPIEVQCPKGACKLVFVTSSIYAGSFGTGAVGGTPGDQQCLSAAASSGNPSLLGRTFRAWLSTVNVPAKDRLTPSKGPYRRLDGRMVASNFTVLTSGNLESAIALTEGGGTLLLDNVWTGTKFDGSQGGDSCESWTATTGMGQIGHANEKDARWTQDDIGVSCASAAHLYCVEEP